MGRFVEIKCKVLSVLVAALFLGILSNCSSGNEKALIDRVEQLEKEGSLIVQKAELDIDPEQLERYLELLEEGIRTSVKKEPGVLSLYAIADEDDPAKITVVEIYASQAAYESHINSPHFLKYKNGTLLMVKSLKLTRTKPVVFAAKSK